LKIPVIGVALPIFDQTTDTLLKRGATLLEGASYPIGGLESDSKQRPYNAQLQLVPLNPQHIKEKIWNQKITDMYSGYDLNQGEFQRRHIILF
ncbi:hypothetical protein, partial [Enterococcus casseliflavus]|uniref:hypothetical protein n=1 Tax=Enterococcus casseliflavus TaxID=37734 RepID=UPI003A4C58B2